MVDFTPRMTVTEMIHCDFLNLQTLLKRDYVHCSTNKDDEPVRRGLIKWFKYDFNVPDTYYKHSFSIDETFKDLDIARKQKSLRKSKTRGFLYNPSTTFTQEDKKSTELTAVYPTK